MPVRNILFDLDGTVIDSYPGIQAAFNHAYVKLYGAPCSHDIRAFVGPPIKNIFAEISGEKDASKVELFAGHFQSEYDTDHYRKSELYPGMTDLLKQLSDKGMQLYIATNKRIKPTLLILDYLDIAPYFKAVYSADSTQPSYKSKVEMVAAILENESLNPAETLLIGDTHHDQEAAERNNIGFIYAGYGFGALTGIDKTIDHALQTLNYIA